MVPPVRPQILGINICSDSAATVSSKRLVDMVGPRRSNLFKAWFLGDKSPLRLYFFIQGAKNVTIVCIDCTAVVESSHFQR